ncbi:amino acid adenylation domain-containing protein, partial [Scytonema sp. PCC 10023]|uniref:amino acid adenylation domain-containing protein n=1 Tax=Scytonema sp. PCC 10023 TaxID=1680591 RepID=UPI0039C7090C
QWLQVLCLNSDWQVIAQENNTNPLNRVTADNLIYVMYTSGSTGLPKGVSTMHRSVVGLVQSPNYVRLSVQEVFLQLAPISFDASTFEIWGCLLHGARLVILPPHTPSLQELGQAVEQYGVTTLWLTAGLFHLMVDEQLHKLKCVHQLLAGGDVLSLSHVKQFLQQPGHRHLINGYGPTETTTFACCCPLTKTATLSTSVPIGRPISNTQVYVLDSYLQPVPVGVLGEVYIGGMGLARGYLNRSELTAEKFIPNPLSDEPGARLYKTGDLARYLHDGNIEFVGRIDSLVKLRGYRIELGEVEAILRQHPIVREIVIIVQEYSPGEKRLVAYVVTNLPSESASQELRSFLKNRLPEYMVPSAFVILETLPLTPNGKLNREALPVPDLTTELKGTFAAPRTPIEEMLVGIWAEILGLEKVSIYDNFFELGGHSLLATQLISRVRNAFQVELPLRNLFEASTVASFAENIETTIRAGA